MERKQALKPRLLLLEDEPTSRMFLVAASEALPVEVDAAGSVGSALPLAMRGGHALWLFDANLPDGTGSELLAQLRRHGLETPALAHTANPDPQEQARLLASGFDAVLLKPLPASAWRHAIRAALSGTAHALPEPPHLPAQVQAGDLPLWDDEAAATALGGSRENIAALRSLFIAELPALRDTVLAAADDEDDAGMRACLHRLQASCGFVGASRLGAASRALHEAPDAVHRLRDFVATADATLNPATAPGTSATA